MQRLELKIPPVAVFLIVGGIMWIAAKGLPRVTFPLPGAAIIAATLVVAGAVVGITAVLHFRRQGTTVHPNFPDRSSAIVTGGIYRYTRNPMYLALAAVLTAWAAWLGNLASLACVPGFIAYLTRFQIEPEERALAAKFGAPFRDYMDTVRRWI